MVHSEAEDAGGLSPAKDDNEAVRHFIRRTLPIPDCVDKMDEAIGRKLMPLPWCGEMDGLMEEAAGKNWVLQLPYLWYNIRKADIKLILWLRMRA